MKKAYALRLSECRNNSGSLRATIRHADGRWIDLFLTFIPQFSRDNDFDCYNVTVDPVKACNLVSHFPAHTHAIVRKILDCLAGTFSIVDQSGNLLVWNKKLENVSKMTSEEIRSAHMLDFFEGHGKLVMQEKIGEAFQHGDAFMEADLVAKDGSATPYLFSGSRIEVNGELYVCGMGLDISKQREQEEMLRLSNRALLASVNGIVIARHAGKDNPIMYINPAFERITGYKESEVIGQDLRFMEVPGLDELERQKILQAISQCKETHVVFRNLRKSGEMFWNELTIAPVQNNDGEVTHFIGVINDITESRQRTFHLEHEANHDALTGLANRNLFQDRLEQAIYSATRNQSLLALVFVDLDGFKLINDTEGHEAGDEVLRAISKRLKASVRENDTVARMGGDEFVLILVNQPSLRFTLRMIERLRESISKPVLAGRKELNIGASIGVSVFPHDGLSGNELLHAADAAMYHAKTAGRNNAQFFSSEMKSTMEAKRELENNLRDAIEKNELFLVYQPRICIKTAKIIGAEVLLRWRHPKRGILTPPAFIPLAEESGLIVALGEWVLQHTCSMLRRIEHHGISDFGVSLNVGCKEFGRPEFAAMLDRYLSTFRIVPSRLEIGIAEEALMRNPELSIDALSELSRLGVKLAADNFGTGFSSLSYLQKFHLDHLEIDRSFIADISIDGADAAITKTVITMGHNLDIDVVAKGVETVDQLNFLKRHNCDQVQGNFFSGPVYPVELEQLLKRNATLQL